MDAAGELWEIVKWGAMLLITTLLGAVSYYFRREAKRVESRLDEHDEELEKRATVEQLTQLKIEHGLMIRALDGDIKNLGEKFTAAMRSEMGDLRQELTRTAIEQSRRLDEQNKRLDAILLAVTTRNNAQG